MWVNRDDRAKFLADIGRTGSLRDIECQFRTRRGTVHTMLISAEIIEINREPHMLIVGLDITRRKQAETDLRKSEARLRESEDRFSRAFRASPALMAISRMRDGKFIEANDAFVRWFGLDRHGILGRDSQELGIWVNRNDRAKFLADVGRTSSLREVECQFRTWQGTVRTMLVSAEIIEVNREPHMLGFCFDVTARKQAEAELLRTLGQGEGVGAVAKQFRIEWCRTSSAPR
jgi:PAS domain S-box-containing protein